jgi:hypothetical protein
MHLKAETLTQQLQLADFLLTGPFRGMVMLAA